MERFDTVYLGTTDSLAVNQVETISQKVGYVETFVGVIGGFACFTLIEKIRPQKIILYDRNPAQLVVFNFIKSLVQISSDPENFVSRLFSRTDFWETKLAENLLLDDTIKKLQILPDYVQSWATILSVLATAKTLDRGVYFTSDTNGSRPLFVLNPLKYDLNKEELKRNLPYQHLSLYLGQGWLKDSQSFQYVRNILKGDTVKVMELKIPRIKPLKDFWSKASNLLWVSNIRFFKRWKKYPAEERLQFLRRLPEKIKILTSKKLLESADLLDLKK